MDQNNNDFFEENNQTEQPVTKQESALGRTMASIFAVVVVACLTSLIVATTAKLILWIL